MAVSLPQTGPLADVLARVNRVRRSGTGYVGLCPAHGDENASLSISEGKDGRVLINCHAGCQPAAVIAALGLEMTSLFQPRASVLPFEKPPVVAAAVAADRPRLVKSYDYVDADGKLLFQACRFVTPDGKKTFRQRRPDGSGGWIWDLESVTPVLYRLPEVIAAAESGRSVYIVEGEKDADALAEFGYVATTNPMGAGKWRDHYSDWLIGAEVCVFPDNDDIGKLHAQEVAASLAARKCTVRVVLLPDLPEKGDISDWLDKGGSLDELEAIVGRTRIWTLDPDAAGKRNRWRLDELWGNDTIMRPPPSIVPRLAWAGRLTLIAAREKSGKSTLTGFMAAQVSQGREFLGAICEKGDVLVIGLEEFTGDTARRLRHFDADATRVYLVDRLIGDPQERPHEVRTHVEAVKPALVILDSLSAYSAGYITDENNATQMTAVLKPLADLAHELNPAIVVLHHANKTSGKARGSTGIMAQADVVCEFFAPEEDTDPTLRRMRSAGRVPVFPRWDFRFDGDTYILADGMEAPIEQRILAVVASRPAISLRDLCEHLGSRWSDVQSAVMRLVIQGHLHNSGTPKYMKLMVIHATGEST